MSKAVLTAAKELIDTGKYHEAATILRTLPDDPTAKKWLATLEAKYLPPSGPTSIGLTAKEMRAYEAKRLGGTKNPRIGSLRRSRAIWSVVFLLGMAFLCYGLVMTSGAVAQVSRNASEATQAGAAIGGGLSLLFYLCLGGPVVLAGLYFYYRIGGAIRREEMHAEQMEVLNR
jgi:hypothetical protein